ncbi:hypothetical protein [Coleofasciculus sp. F4-SAH-05]|uniref:hypothetical protein n=1 Tax=Coleofasciculus sp. F4-SAH-05 TaxID=3069525 RepID=UPI0032F33F8D
MPRFYHSSKVSATTSLKTIISPPLQAIIEMAKECQADLGVTEEDIKQILSSLNLQIAPLNEKFIYTHEFILSLFRHSGCSV